MIHANLSRSEANRPGFLPDIAAIVVLCAFAWVWPRFAAPQFWSDALAHRDILGVDSEMYFNAVRDSVKFIAFERRPIFGVVLLALRYGFKTIFGMSDAAAAASAFHTVAISVPVLVYALGRLLMGTRASFVLALLAASTMTVMFHTVIYESYALTMAAGVLAAFVATATATVGYPWVAAHPFAAGTIAVMTVTIAGWAAITLFSFLLPFAFIGLLALGLRRGTLWSVAVALISGVLLVLPSLLIPESSEIQKSIAATYFDAARVFSGAAWTNVLVSNLIVAFLYPGHVLGGSNHPNSTGPEDWMSPIVADALSAPPAILVGLVFVALALLSIGWLWSRRLRSGDARGGLILGIWGSLAASIAFFVMWVPTEAALFIGCVWPLIITLVIFGRAKMGGRSAIFADVFLLVLAVALFLANLDVLKATAAFYQSLG